MRVERVLHPLRFYACRLGSNGVLESLGTNLVHRNPQLAGSGRHRLPTHSCAVVCLRVIILQPAIGDVACGAGCGSLQRIQHDGVSQRKRA